MRDDTEEFVKRGRGESKSQVEKMSSKFFVHCTRIIGQLARVMPGSRYSTANF